MKQYNRVERVERQSREKSEKQYKPRKKRSFKKTVIEIIIGLLVVGLFAVAYLFIKINGLTDDIHDPLSRGEYSERRDGPINTRRGEPMSVAIFGIDSDEKRDAAGGGERSDAIMLLSINPKDKKTVLVSIPRDTRTEIVGMGTIEKVNHAYAYGGPQMAVDTLENFMDVPIDHYMSINMDGVHELIDDVGGVDVVSNGTFTVKGIDFVEGESYHMDGDTALKFMRSRYEAGSGGDGGRQVRQQLVIEALTNKMLSVSSITHMNKIFDTIGKNVRTDLTAKEIQSLAFKYRKANDNVEKLQLVGQDMVLDDGLWYFIPDEQNFYDVQHIYKSNLNLEY